MTIQLVTGTPGAGKTTYAVAEVIAKEVGRQIKLDDETCIPLCLDLGTVVPRRIVCAGVRGLRIEHERLPHILTRDRVLPSEVAKWNEMVCETVDGKRVETDEPVHQRLPSDPPLDVPALAQNWWLWCKPGDLIVIDEVQFLAPRGTLGRKPPYWIEALSIHRHYGVDFLLITQDVQGIDTFIRGKVGLHTHVRAMMGSALCMVYSWDHCSNTERTSLAAKKAWLRRAKHYRLFHSSVAHVAPPTSGRGGVYVALVLAVVFAFAFRGFMGKFQPKEAEAAVVSQSASSPILPSLAASSASAVEDAPKQLQIVGCIDGERERYCIDSQGGRVDMPPKVVAWNARNMGGYIKHDMSRTASAFPVVAPEPERAQPMGGVGGFADPSPRPNPVRPLSGGLYSVGGSSTPGDHHDGSVLAGMRRH